MTFSTRSEFGPRRPAPTPTVYTIDWDEDDDYIDPDCLCPQCERGELGVEDDGSLLCNYCGHTA